jgi:hypothetical protein
MWSNRLIYNLILSFQSDRQFAAGRSSSGCEESTLMGRGKFLKRQGFTRRFNNHLPGGSDDEIRVRVFVKLRNWVKGPECRKTIVLFVPTMAAVFLALASLRSRLQNDLRNALRHTGLSRTGKLATCGRLLLSGPIRDLEYYSVFEYQLAGRSGVRASLNGACQQGQASRLTIEPLSRW